jgi:predicted Zn-dependent protease
MSGSSADEKAQYHDALALAGGDRPEQMLAALDSLLKKCPGNRPGRLTRADILMELGQTAEADSDLKLLATESPDSYAVYGREVRLARIRGRARDELDAYKAMAAVSPSDPSLEALINPPELVQARVAELGGDLASAERIFAQLASHQTDQYHLGYLEAYAEFKVRHGQYADAARDYLAVIGGMPTGANFTEGAASLREDLAGVLWASERKADAAAQVNQALHLLIDWKNAWGRTPETLAPVTLMSWALARGVPNGDDSKVITMALDREAESLKAGNFHGFEIPIAALVGRMDGPSAFSQVESTLKAAPFLEWALWSELYLGLAFPQDSGRVLDHLPSGTIQRDIWIQEAKSAR